MKQEIAPRVGGTPEEIKPEYELVLVDADTGQEARGDYYSVDWGQFGDRLRHSFATQDWEQSMLRGATKPDWQDAETHEAEFTKWFEHRADMLMDQAFVLGEDGTYSISDDFIADSLSPAMVYQLGFTFRRARELFTDEQIATIKEGVQRMLDSNDLSAVLEVLAHVGSCDELLPSNRSTTIASSDFLIKEALRGLPKKENVPTESAATDDAKRLIAKLVSERIKLKLASPD